jgi:hypothetical protein
VLPVLYLHGMSSCDFGPALEQFLGSAADCRPRGSPGSPPSGRTTPRSSGPVAEGQGLSRARLSGAQILGSRGSEHWLPGFERLRVKLHLAPGILEHQTVAESMERDRNGPAYAQTRIDEINDEARKRARQDRSPARRRAAE